MVQSDQRARIARLQALLEEAPQLTQRYGAAKAIVRAFRRPAFYEIATRCNLLCEGCYYFADGFAPTKDESDIATWSAFFSAEAARGVSMAYFVGAEPALEQERLIAAAAHFPNGNIGTNGTIRLDPAIPYRIGVSLWGVDAEIDSSLRGAGTFAKAIRNYAGDPRAIMLYTVTRTNIGDLPRLAAICRDHALPLTFNMYSPTATYLRQLAAFGGNDDRYFRISRPGANLCWDDASLASARNEIAKLITAYPDTVVYSRAYNDWVTRPGPLYDIDAETGIARDCHSRMTGHMRYFTTDLQRGAAKCGTPDAVCDQCRMYSGGWSSRFEPRAEDLRDLASFEDWLDMIATLGRIFLIDHASALNELAVA